VATTQQDRMPLASTCSGWLVRVFMITGIGVHDRTESVFKITGMRTLDKSIFYRCSQWRPAGPQRLSISKLRAFLHSN
jgi:hypothetical protein